MRGQTRGRMGAHVRVCACALGGGAVGEDGRDEAHPTIVAPPGAAGISAAWVRGEKGAMGREDLSRFATRLYAEDNPSRASRGPAKISPTQVVGLRTRDPERSPQTARHIVRTKC